MESCSSSSASSNRCSHSSKPLSSFLRGATVGLSIILLASSAVAGAAAAPDFPPAAGATALLSVPSGEAGGGSGGGGALPRRVAKAAVDECLYQTGLSVMRPAPCPQNSRPKVNGAYVFGMTKASASSDVWFGTGENNQCVIMGSTARLRSRLNGAAGILRSGCTLAVDDSLLQLKQPSMSAPPLRSSTRCLERELLPSCRLGRWAVRRGAATVWLWCERRKVGGPASCGPAHDCRRRGRRHRPFLPCCAAGSNNAYICEWGYSGFRRTFRPPPEVGPTGSQTPSPPPLSSPSVAKKISSSLAQRLTRFASRCTRRRPALRGCRAGDALRQPAPRLPRRLAAPARLRLQRPRRLPRGPHAPGRPPPERHDRCAPAAAGAGATPR